jgi:hypothetical protein
MHDSLLPGAITKTMNLAFTVSSFLFPCLHTIQLRGFDTLSSWITKFLSDHKSTLVKIYLEDCNIADDGSWHDVLSELLESTSLRLLSLCQLGQEWRRFEFPLTCSTDMYMGPDGFEDWVHVLKDWHKTTIGPHQIWRASLTAIIQDIRVMNREVNPDASDAWYWE